MDLRDLEVFVQIATAGGFNRAAESLFVAQSALSRRVAKLEHEIGTKLFTRSKRGARLTPAGQVLIDQAQDLLNQFERVRSEMLSEAKEPRGTLAIGLPPSLMSQSTKFLQAYRNRFPLVQVRAWMATTVSLRSMLLEGKLDIAICAANETNALVEEIHLFDDPLCLIVPSELDLQTPVRWDAIAEMSMMLPSRPNSVRTLVEAAALKHQVRLDIALDANDVSLLIELASHGVGSTVLPMSAASLVQSERVSIAPLPDLSLRWVAVRMKERASSIAAMRAVEMIKATIGTKDPAHPD